MSTSVRDTKSLLTCLDCSSVISSDAFIPFSVISLRDRHDVVSEELERESYQLTIFPRPSQSLLPLNRA